MPELNTNTLVLLVLIVAIVLFDFFRRRKNDSKQLVPIEKRGSLKKYIVISVLLVLVAIVLMKMMNYSEQNDILTDEVKIEQSAKKTELESLKSALEKYDFDDPRWENEDYFFSLLDTFFKKYYSCLECVELLANTYGRGGMTDTYAQKKVIQFSRAIELGTTDINILLQNVRYKIHLKDKVGYNQGMVLLEEKFNDDKGVEKYKNTQYALFYVYKSQISNMREVIDNNIHLMAIEYFDKSLNDVKDDPDQLKKRSEWIVNTLKYDAVHWFGTNYNNYNRKWFPYPQRETLCSLLSRTGSYGAQEAYMMITDNCK